MNKVWLCNFLGIKETNLVVKVMHSKIYKKAKVFVVIKLFELNPFKTTRRFHPPPVPPHFLAPTKASTLRVSKFSPASNQTLLA